MNSKVSSALRGIWDGHRADLYMALAEVLDQPPPWLALPGQQWPLFAAAETLAPVSAAAKRAAATISAVGAEPLSKRRARHRALFHSKGRPHFWLHESLYRSGRLLGPQMVEVAQLYRVAGLQIAGGELPDHASVELAFLAHLACQAKLDPQRAGQWRQTEKRFLRKHAARWLPELGRALAASGDAVYAPIGLLLAGWLQEGARQARPRRLSQRLPLVVQAQCTLCSFCVQVCPTRALLVEENATRTTLLLAADRCSGCSLCAKVCNRNAIHMHPVDEEMGDADIHRRRLLMQSPRAACPACGEPTISSAELDYVADQLGHPPWLAYCLHCRTG